MREGTVILMEDDEDLSQLYSLSLEAAGYHVITQTNSKNIVNLVEAHHPLVVISDMVMPDFEGLEGIFKIIDHHHIPIIAISAHPNYLSIAETLVSACLLKPFTGARLLEEVNRVVDKQPV